MKSICRIVLISLILSIFLTSCTLDKDNPLIFKDKKNETTRNSSKFFAYHVDQVSLTKSYQNLEPNVDVLNWDKGKIQILISAGLIESSGVEVNDVKRDGNLIKIHINNKSTESKNQYVVPKIYLTIQGLDRNDDRNLEFQIINDNYENYKLKHSVNDVIAKIESEFNITTVTFPNVNLIKDQEKDIMVWDINFVNVFNNDYKNSPIIDLDVLVDAKTSEVIWSEKSSSSQFIDEGQILDYLENQYLIYKKVEDGKDSLWIYDVNSKEKEKLYLANNPIIESKIDNETNLMYILEKKEDRNELSILCMDDLKIYKTLLKDEINPKLVEWGDGNSLYILDSDKETTSFYNYNIDTDEIELFKTLESTFINFEEYKGIYLLTTLSKETEKTEFYIVRDFNDDYTLIRGHKPKFLDGDRIGYLEFSEEKGRNTLEIYSLEEDAVIDYIDLNIVNFFMIEDNKLALIEKNSSDRTYSFYTYDIENKKLTFEINTMGEDMRYNSNQNLLYINLGIPNKEECPKLIFSFKLSKLLNE